VASPEPPKSPETDLGSPAEKLEEEIDQSIDSRFVQKDTGSEGVQSVASRVNSAKPLEASEVELQAPAPSVSPEVPSADREPSSGSTQGPTRNLENLEAHLLSLEWEISPDLIDKVISELGFLKGAYDSDRALFQVFEMMSNVAHALADDEGNITPDNLRFLLEAKDGIKLLLNELKDKEAYRNLVLSGILAKHHLMQERREGPGEPTDHVVEGKDAEGLAETLKTLSHELQKEIRQLGVITQKLRTGSAHSASSETVTMLLVTSSGRVFAIEKDLVLRSVQIPYRMVRTVWKDNEIRIRGDRFPLVNLFRLFKFKDSVEPKEKTVVLIKKDNRTLAVLVDRLLQKREVPARSIREEKSLAYLRGTAPIGKGRKMYLLDTDRLMVEF
jgi:chemotaxis protein histidine kinase CheA